MLESGPIELERTMDTLLHTLSPVPWQPALAGGAGRRWPAQRIVVAALIAAVHVALASALWHARVAHRADIEPPALLVQLITPSIELPPPPPPPPPAQPIPQPVLTPLEPYRPPEALPRDTVPAPVVEVRAPVVAAEPVAEPAAPPVADAGPAGGRWLPPSAVQYLEAPVLVYPRASRRAGEAGKVQLRVFIDEQGLPRDVQVTRSSGFARLDESAVSAVRKARFKPATDNGRPLAGWAPITLTFELET